MSYTNGLDKPTDYFNTVLYTGNGSTQSITGVDHQPDFVWIKNRTTNFGSRLLDSVRTATKELFSNATSSENTNTDSLTSFNSDGFTLGSHGGVNENSSNFVSWNWKKTATAGFDIVSYTGNGSARTISHSLSAIPKMIIIKNRDDTDSWRVYHASTGNGGSLMLNLTNAFASDSTMWNNTSPTSSVFSLGDHDNVNGNGHKFIAYCFAEKKGYSKFGSYTGNGNADGTFVYTGFKPAWIMFKKTDAGGSWYIKDNKRGGTSAGQNFGQINPNQIQYPSADTNFVENVTSGYSMDILSNGFKARGTDSGINTNGGSYIYMAIAENPFVTSTGIPTTAR